MGSENYEIIDTLESIAKSLESLAESQKKIADTLERLAKDKEVVNWNGLNFWNKKGYAPGMGKMRKTENIIGWQSSITEEEDKKCLGVATLLISLSLPQIEH